MPKTSLRSSQAFVWHILPSILVISAFWYSDTTFLWLETSSPGLLLGDPSFPEWFLSRKMTRRPKCVVAITLFLPGVAAATLRSQLSSYGLEARGEQLAELKLKQWDYFLLMQIIRNLRKGSKVRELIKEMITLNRKINDHLELN